MLSLAYKQKFCGFLEGKIFNKMKVLICEFYKKMLKVIHKKKNGSINRDLWIVNWNVGKYKIQVNKKLTKVKEKWSTIRFDVFVLLFSSFQCTRQKVSKIEVAHAIFYTHQTSGSSACMCVCKHTHQVDKTGKYICSGHSKCNMLMFLVVLASS